jgi:hypothetical protein
MVWTCFWFAFRCRGKYEDTLARSIYASIPSGYRCTYQFIIMIRVSIYLYMEFVILALLAYGCYQGNTHARANNPTRHIFDGHVYLSPFNFQGHFCGNINFACQINIIVHRQAREYIYVSSLWVLTILFWIDKFSCCNSEACMHFDDLCRSH